MEVQKFKSTEKSCDSCRLRGRPCSSCIEKKLTCSYQMPVKKRGPNKKRNKASKSRNVSPDRQSYQQSRRRRPSPSAYASDSSGDTDIEPSLDDDNYDPLAHESRVITPLPSIHLRQFIDELTQHLDKSKEALVSDSSVSPDWEKSLQLFRKELDDFCKEWSTDSFINEDMAFYLQGYCVLEFLRSLFLFLLLVTRNNPYTTTNTLLASTIRHQIQASMASSFVSQFLPLIPSTLPPQGPSLSSELISPFLIENKPVGQTHQNVSTPNIAPSTSVHPSQTIPMTVVQHPKDVQDSDSEEKGDDQLRPFIASSVMIPTVSTTLSPFSRTPLDALTPNHPAADSFLLMSSILPNQSQISKVDSNPPELIQFEQLIKTSETPQDALTILNSFKSSLKVRRAEQHPVPLSFVPAVKNEIVQKHFHTRLIMNYNLLLSLLRMSEGDVKEGLAALAVVADLVVGVARGEGLMPIQSMLFWEQIVRIVLEGFECLLESEASTKKGGESDVKSDTLKEESLSRWAESDVPFVLSLFASFTSFVTVVRYFNEPSFTFSSNLSLIESKLIELNTHRKEHITEAHNGTFMSQLLHAITPHSALANQLESLSATNQFDVFWSQSPFSIAPKLENRQTSLTLVNPGIFLNCPDPDDVQLDLSKQDMNMSSWQPPVPPNPIAKQKREKATVVQSSRMSRQNSSQQTRGEEGANAASRRQRMEHLRSTRRTLNLTRQDTSKIDAELLELEREEKSEFEASPINRDHLPLRTPLNAAGFTPSSVLGSSLLSSSQSRHFIYTPSGPYTQQEPVDSPSQISGAQRGGTVNDPLVQYLHARDSQRVALTPTGSTFATSPTSVLGFSTIGMNTAKTPTSTLFNTLPLNRVPAPSALRLNQVRPTTLPGMAFPLPALPHVTPALPPQLQQPTSSFASGVFTTPQKQVSSLPPITQRPESPFIPFAPSPHLDATNDPNETLFWGDDPHFDASTMEVTDFFDSLSFDQFALGFEDTNLF
ncbi:hypothetical protein BLNAU_14009 [Blattamonas nauphoetae]|uniref:Zn(2)-C6 fungal-type domain-containing protein n=1 Tax=Blattamonas nauphoetae TaxID=2049346 RepID=A0ABQ9XI99_9EUKA|nr:hypothetical protein BLNAU_14009 [Blattamonas nauphoetae]